VISGSIGPAAWDKHGYVRDVVPSTYSQGPNVVESAQNPLLTSGNI